MWNTCWQCGGYRPDKRIDPQGPTAICPECGHGHCFQQLPLLLVSGASGAGKSTVCHALMGRLTQVVLLDSDNLWQPEFNKPDDNYSAFFETWLRMCKNIGQSGRPVVLFGAGVGVPSNLESCIERRYFSTLHYLALTVDDEVLIERLQQRPAWRQSGTEAYLAEHVQFNQWFRSRSALESPAVELIDTTHIPPTTTVKQVAQWIRETMAA